MSTAGRRALAWVLLGLVVCALVWAAGWRIGGGTWLRVDSPSMGTRAPVGSLLWVAPVDPDDIAVGDLLSFRAPTAQDAAPYTHLVSGINADGTLTTAGVLSGPDPWQVAPGDVVGRVERVWFGVGAALQAAPLLAAFGVVTALVVWRVRSELRLPAAVFGAGLALSASIVVHQPLLGAQQLSFGHVDGGARARSVNTGLVPMQMQGRPEGGWDSMKPGEVGTVMVPGPDERGRYEVLMSPALPWWFWLALVSGCFVPAVLSLVRRPGAREAAPAAS